MFKAISRAFAYLGSGIKNIFKTAMTGPNGKDYAPGRIMAAVVFIISQWIVVSVTQSLLTRRFPLMPLEWQTHFITVSGFEVAITAACVALVLGNAPADPNGKWWGKDAQPPMSPPQPDKES